MNETITEFIEEFFENFNKDYEYFIKSNNLTDSTKSVDIFMKDISQYIDNLYTISLHLDDKEYTREKLEETDTELELYKTVYMYLVLLQTDNFDVYSQYVKKYKLLLPFVCCMFGREVNTQVKLSEKLNTILKL